MMPDKSQTRPQMPPRKVYSREFKLETLRLLKNSGKTKVDSERELGLYPGQIHLWERAFNKEGGNVEQAFPGTGHQSDAEQGALALTVAVCSGCWRGGGVRGRQVVVAHDSSLGSTGINWKQISSARAPLRAGFRNRHRGRG